MIGLVLSCWASAGCAAPESDLSKTPKYASTIGTYYRTKVDLYALGLYSTDGSNKVVKIWVSPFPATGPEVAYRHRIPEGQHVRVLAVRKSFVLLENGLHFVVAMDGLNLPADLEIIVPLYGELQETDGFLDADRFEKVSAPLP